MYTVGDVRVEEREDSKIVEPTDAIVPPLPQVGEPALRVLACGGDKLLP
jgi:hypothetical protein